MKRTLESKCSEKSDDVSQDRGSSCKPKSIKIDALRNKLSMDISKLSRRLLEDFYDVPCETLARELLGQILVRKFSNGEELRCKIVETECYPGHSDTASHSFNGKKTNRNSPMYMKPGTTYVYFTYGMYHCFNISSQGEGAAVLIRAAEPLEGLNIMQRNRQAYFKSPKNELKPHMLCNGPSKLCISLDIHRHTSNAKDLSTWPEMWVEKSTVENDKKIVLSPRIGISSSGIESASKLLRFYLLGNTSVSKRDKVNEKILLESLDAS